MRTQAEIEEKESGRVSVCTTVVSLAIIASNGKGLAVQIKQLSLKATSPTHWAPKPALQHHVVYLN